MIPKSDKRYEILDNLFYRRKQAIVALKAERPDTFYRCVMRFRYDIYIILGYVADMFVEISYYNDLSRECNASRCYFQQFLHFIPVKDVYWYTNTAPNNVWAPIE